jgi:hypothetical protein
MKKIVVPDKLATDCVHSRIGSDSSFQLSSIDYGALFPNKRNLDSDSSLRRVMMNDSVVKMMSGWTGISGNYSP